MPSRRDRGEIVYVNENRMFVFRILADLSAIPKTNLTAC